MSDSSSYLEKIKYHAELGKSVVASYIKNIRFVILLTISIITVGIFGYVNLPKRLNPEIKIPIVNVVTILPGASPEDAESLITIPLENQIKSIKGIDKITSVSRDNISVITIQFFSYIDPEKAKNEVQSKVDEVSDLPQDALTPSVKALDFEDQPVLVFALSTNKGLPTLMRFSENLKRSIDELPSVDRVNIQGFENQEIAIEINPEKISELGVNPFALAQTIQSATLSYPAGNVESSQNTFSISIDPKIEDVESIRSMLLFIQGNHIKLGDIASVSRRSKKDTKESYIASRKTDAQRAVIFYVYKTTGTNIDTAGNAVTQLVQEEIAKTNNSFTVSTIQNTAQNIDDQFSELLGEFQTTIVLIVLCLFVFLGLRQALISSLTVPLTFLAAFFIMTLFKQSINFLTLFAFLIALGLLIDDTVVIVSAMTTYYKTGKFSPFETGVLVWRDTIIPIWSTTLTTIQSFVPLLITSGIIGEFIKPIPIVVSAVMMSSTAIAVLITLPLMIVLLKPRFAPRVKFLIKIIGAIAGFVLIGFIVAGNPFFTLIMILYLLILVFIYLFGDSIRKKISFRLNIPDQIFRIYKAINKVIQKGVIDLEPISQAYYRLIMKILNSKTARTKVIVIIGIYSLISFMLLPLGQVKSEFFPKTDADTIYVNLSLPAGTNLSVTTAETKRILNRLKNIPETTFVTAEVGQSYSSGFSRSENTYSSLFTIHLPKEENRKKKSYEIANDIRTQFELYDRGTISVIERSAGPPAGADLQIKLLGTNLGVLDTYADKLINYLKKEQGVANVDKAVKQSTSRFVFVPDEQKLIQYGITRDTVGFWLRSYLTGFKLKDFNFDKQYSEKTDITLHLSNTIIRPDEILELSIPTNTQSYIPLHELGVFEAKTSPSFIVRENTKRSLSVTASVLPGFNIADKNKKLEGYAKTLNLPVGYEWQTGGVNEENQKSVNSILQAMIVAFILILITMVLQFQSYRQAVIVLLVIPLAVSSVFIIFALTGTPLSFPALIGILSLFGIVVTNSMFIVDKINMNIKESMPFKEAIADAGASRLEPIILTKLNTVLGLIPITISDPLWRGLGGAIISGILFSSSIMLLFIPSVYYWWFAPQINKE